MTKLWQMMDGDGGELWGGMAMRWKSYDDIVIARERRVRGAFEKGESLFVAPVKLALAIYYTFLELANIFKKRNKQKNYGCSTPIFTTASCRTSKSI